MLRFTKMHGLGNDFVLLDLISQNLHISEKDIQQLADRRTGIGFDQLLTVSPPQSPQMDFYYRSYNADGSEAEQCGNGARCFMRFVRDRGLTTKTCIKVETKSGSIECKLERDGNVTVNLGSPRLDPQDIPFIAEQAQILYDFKLNTSAVCASEINLELAAVSMGNPHAVLKVDSVESAPVGTWGPIIESHQRFPQKVNVGFMEVVSREKIKLRVFERGVGETMACGSGACAAMVAGRLQGLLDEVVSVQFRGGVAKVRWKGNDSPVYLTGPVCRVYEGRLHI